MTAAIKGGIPKDFQLIQNLPGVNNVSGKIYWNDFVNKYRNDPRLDVWDIYFLDELVRYYSNPKNWGQNWTKKRSYSYFKKGVRPMSKYRIDKIYEHLISFNYMEQILIAPHKITDDITDKELAKISGQYNTRFYWLYRINFQPDIVGEISIPKKETKVEVNEMLITNDNMKDVMEDYMDMSLDDEETHVYNEETDYMNMDLDDEEYNIEDEYMNMDLDDEEEAEEEITDAYIQEQYKAGIFENVIDRCEINTLSNDTIKYYIKDYLTKYNINADDFSLENLSNDDLYTLCWYIIVKSIAYNDTAFEKLINSEVGQKMCEINKRAIERSFLEYSMYSVDKSKIKEIRENTKLNTFYRKKLLIHSAIVIHNYIKLGLLENKKLPDYKELIGLFKVLNDNPTLIYTMTCTKKSYQELNTLFIENQERYNLIT